MAEFITFDTTQKEVLVDITMDVRRIVQQSRVTNGLLNLFTPGGSSAILIQPNFNDDASTDLLDLLAILIPEGVWLHDAGAGTADAYLKAGLIGPSKVIPLVGGALLLSDDQRVVFCEFNGPRSDRQVVASLLSDR